MVAKPKPKKTIKSKKKKSPSERKKLVYALDTIVSLIVRKRDGECVTKSNCYGSLTCSHYFDRTNWGIRWDLRNCNAQCSSHNNSHNYHTYAYSEYMKKRYGNAIFGMLLAEETKYRKNGKWTTPELRDLLVKLTKEWEKMQ
jgi:hypothetical protein